MTQLRLVLWFPEAVLLSSVFPYVVPFFPFFLFNFLHLPVWVNSPWTDGVISDIRSPDTDCFLSCSYMAGGSCNLRMVRMSGAGARLFFLPCDILTILSTHTSSVAVRAGTVGHTGLECRRALVQGSKYVVIIFCFLAPAILFRRPTWRQGLGNILRLALHSVSLTAHSTKVLDQSSQYRGTGQLSLFHLHLNPSKQFAFCILFSDLMSFLRIGTFGDFLLQKGWAITMPALTAYVTPNARVEL